MFHVEHLDNGFMPAGFVNGTKLRAEIPIAWHP
jgi:hypothetical protein